MLMQKSHKRRSVVTVVYSVINYAFRSFLMSWSIRDLWSFQRLNFVDVATGSLGQGLSCAAGMAYTAKYFDKSR